MARRSDQWKPLLATYPESQKLAQVSPLAECLYLRLLASTEDDAVTPGHPGELLWGCLAARARRGGISEDDVSRCLDELEGAGLCARYQVDGVPYVALLGAVRYCKKGRYKPSQHPLPPGMSQPCAPEDHPGGLFEANATPEWRQRGARVEPSRAHDHPTPSNPDTQIPSNPEPEGAGAPARPRSGIKLALALLPELAPTVAGDAEGAGAWEEWARFKSSSRKPLSARAIRKQLAQAEREGPAWLVGAVEHSIRSDYQGLYPPSPARNGAPGSGNPAIDRLDAMAKRHAPPTPQPEEPRTVELEP